ncbi:extracellular solute-binding protein [Streptococcus suis]|uniref:extracellular solute-binding protein n=1 Tax=Streptococcus suis TaxID=1307 RepID=UPI001ABE7F3A|nr:extracellular solute-binding protein [Streptococcus suis]MBO4110288.1 extracellular solute-binding protein [Streptococcus suis]
MKLKKIITLFSASAIALTLAACAGGQKAEKDAPADRSETLVIYSNSVSDGRGEWLTEKAKEEGFKIEMVEVGGAELADRVIAEKNNGLADMVFGIGAVDSNKLRDEKLLIKFNPEWQDKIDKELADKDGYYNPVIVQPLVLIGRQDAKKMPSDWTQLGSQFAGKYSINGLQSGTSRAILASILVRYLDKNGELGISDKGWKVAKDYIQNAYILKEGESSVVKMLDDKDPITYGMMWGSGALVNQKTYNTKFQVMSPKIGVPFVTEQTMILSSSKRQALAKEFINWFGTADVQAEYAKQFGSIPANKDAVKELPEETQEFLNSVHQQDIDWEVVGENLDLWVEKVELEFVK